MKYNLIKLSPEQKKQQEFLVKTEKLSPLVAKYIALKNLPNDELDYFLRPTLEKLDDCNKIKDIDKAYDMIMKKIKNNRTDDILIVGDYDVDGVTATSTLVWFFRKKFNIELHTYIPERIEGYGLKPHIIDYAIQNNHNLIITVDNGISAFEAVDYAKEKGLEVIITDHHQMQDGILPNADAVLNTVQEDCEYKDKHISGVGMAWNLCRKFDYDLSLFLMPILAIGTIADLVLLQKENRVYVHEGTRMKLDQELKGLISLMKALEISDSEDHILSTTEVGFKIGPVINSAGRLGYAKKALRLMISRDQKEIDILVQELLELNVERKNIGKRMEEDALRQLDEIDFGTKENPKASLIIYPKEDDQGVKIEYNPAIVGIVASRILEKVQIPVVMFGEKEINGEECLSGSARSVDWFDYMKLLSKLREENLLVQGGGHKMAAGFAIKKNDIKKVEKVFEDLAKETYQERTHIDILDIIRLTENKSFDKKTLKSINNEFQKIEPFGQGNQFPSLAFDVLEPTDYKFIGKDKKHFSFRTKSGISVMAWNQTINGKIPDLNNKLFVADINELEFTPEGSNKSFPYFQFNLKYIVDKN